MPPGSGDAVVIASGGGLMVILKLRLAVRDALSVTVAVKLKLPAVVGVPEINPSGESESPAGGEPDHRYGGVPPEAASDCEYGDPTVPSGRGEVVVIVSGGGAPGRIVMMKLRLAEPPAASVTPTVKPKIPAVVGVPVIFPAELRESPFGRVPETSENWYGAFPFEAVTWPE
jgi:hypothetical protein